MLVFLTIFSFLLDSYLKFSSSYYALLIQNINPILHIRCKLIQVIPTQQPNRVLIHKPTRIRLVIPEEVVMQPSLAVGRRKGWYGLSATLVSAFQTTSKKVLRSSEKRKPRTNRPPPTLGLEVLCRLRLAYYQEKLIIPQFQQLLLTKFGLIR